jgi:hypothetical protein
MSLRDWLASKYPNIRKGEVVDITPEILRQFLDDEKKFETSPQVEYCEETSLHGSNEELQHQQSFL